MTTTTTTRRTITPTGHAPVRIVVDNWPIVAQAYDRSDNHRHTVKLTVRQHTDGRLFVYGVVTNPWAWGIDPAPRAGELLGAGEGLVPAMRKRGRFAGGTPVRPGRTCVGLGRVAREMGRRPPSRRELAPVSVLLRASFSPKEDPPL
jgi:hypothetical protein